MRSIQKNHTWELVSLPEKKRIGLRWLYKTKLNPDGSVLKHKARLVARGLLQKHSINYYEVFYLMAKLETIRLIVVVASNEGWSLYHLDVKTTFLNGPLEETMYVTKPSGLVIKGNEDVIYKLHKDFMV